MPVLVTMQPKTQRQRLISSRLSHHHHDATCIKAMASHYSFLQLRMSDGPVQISSIMLVDDIVAHPIEHCQLPFNQDSADNIHIIILGHSNVSSRFFFFILHTYFTKARDAPATYYNRHTPDNHRIICPSLLPSYDHDEYTHFTQPENHKRPHPQTYDTSSLRGPSLCDDDSLFFHRAIKKTRKNIGGIYDATLLL